mmetsp:Transcript_10460/g.24248  ORF Transcript_10460/g.24248 Transcript_10460/m.24248 type:complete len:214 (-) Transcript_10460:930-1571(-)
MCTCECTARGDEELNKNAPTPSRSGSTHSPPSHSLPRSNSSGPGSEPALGRLLVSPLNPPCASPLNPPNLERFKTRASTQPFISSDCSSSTVSSLIPARAAASLEKAARAESPSVPEALPMNRSREGVASSVLPARARPLRVTPVARTAVSAKKLTRDAPAPASLSTSPPAPLPLPPTAEPAAPHVSKACRLAAQSPPLPPSVRFLKAASSGC